MKPVICILYILCTGPCLALSSMDSLSKIITTTQTQIEVDNNRVAKNRILAIFNICNEIIFNAPQEQIKKWNRLFEIRIADKIQNDISNREMAMTQIAHDWWFDNRGKLKEGEKTVLVEACLLMRSFIEAGVLPPIKFVAGVNNRLMNVVIHKPERVGYDILVTLNEE